MYSPCVLSMARSNTWQCSCFDVDIFINQQSQQHLQNMHSCAEPHLLLLVRDGIVKGRPALVVAGVHVLPDGQEVLNRLRVAVPAAQQRRLVDSGMLGMTRVKPSQRPLIRRSPAGALGCTAPDSGARPAAHDGAIGSGCGCISTLNDSAEDAEDTCGHA